LVKKIMVILVILILFTACANSVLDNPPGPELITPAATRFDTIFIDRGAIENVAQHRGVTRPVSHPVTFGNHSGFFGHFYVQPGDVVREGQLLARLYSETLFEQISSVEEHLVNLRRAHNIENNLHTLEIDLLVLEQSEMMRQGAETADVALMERAETHSLEIARLELAQQQANQRHALAVAHATEDLTQLRETLRLREIAAPFDGTISYIPDIRPGSFVLQGRHVLYLTTGYPLFVEKIGSPHAFQPLIVQYIRGNVAGRPMELAHWPLSRAEMFVHGTGGGARFVPTNAADTLQLGEYVELLFYRDLLQDVVRVPVNAKFRGGMVDGVPTFYVLLVVNETLVPTTIEIGVTSESFAEVLYGLQEGDEVYVRS